MRTPRLARGYFRRFGECGRDQACKETCDDLFRSYRHRNDCEDLSVEAVKAIKEIVEVMENPNIEDLEGLDFEVLELLFDISSDPLKEAISRMTQQQQKHILTWLAEDAWTTARIIIDSEDEFEILEELFGEKEEEIISNLNRNIDSGDSFVEIALDEGNEEVLVWIHDFFEEKCDDATRQYERCVFEQYYCKLSLSTYAEDEFFRYEFFEYTLDTVLENHRPETLAADHWWGKEVDAVELDAWKSEPHNVCGALGVVTEAEAETVTTQ